MGESALDATTAVKDALGRLDKAVEKIETMKVVPAASNESGTQNNATWNVNAGGAGVWVATTACIVSVIVCGFALWVASETKADVRSERLSREIMNKWTAQEVTAIRSYITTGKLAPMSPPPTTNEEKP